MAEETGCMFSYEGKVYLAQDTARNFLGENILVGPDTWEELSKFLSKVTISGQDESSENSASYECLSLGPQRFVVRVEDKNKLPG